MRTLSGEYIGGAAEHVWAFPEPIDLISLPKGKLRSEAYEIRWQGIGEPVMVGRGVGDAWWTFPEFHWVPAKVVLSKLGYCRQLGVVGYLKAKLILYGNGILIQPGDRVQRHSKKLRREVGKPGPRHVVQYNYRKWCDHGEAYSEDVWTEWR